MGAPIPQLVLSTFAPPTDSWDGSHYTDENEETTPYRGWIDDEYDFHFEDLRVGHYHLGWAWSWKRETHAGTINRIRCAFSVSTLPNDGQTTIIAMTYDDTEVYDPENDPFNWWSPWGLYLNTDGTLTFWITNSDYPVVAGQTYDMEVWVRYYFDTGISDYKYQLYLYMDGDLWLTDSWTQGALYQTVYAQLIMGYDWWGQGWHSPISGYVHFGDVIWTQEDYGGARWTMMAPGIA